MAYLDRDEETICALTTGAGHSGVAVIRVSGPDSFARVKQLCSFLPEQPESHRLYYGLLKDRTQSSAIDEVLVSYFGHGRSYTGEETCEISCHGNPVLAAQILSELVSVGCRPAERGEFTFRAFLNGRIDLVQAESVLALIESSSKKAAQLSLDQLQGQLSQLFRAIEEDIVWILSRIEAEIDFSTEGLEIIQKEVLLDRLEKLLASIEKLITSYDVGRLITDGIKIVLAGKPNAGKSSLLNALIKSDRAIVSPKPGTTRDTVDVIYKVNGLTATLTDTAGIRQTEDEIEKLGVERSLRALQASDLVLYIVDANDLEVDHLSDMEQLKAQSTIVVLNKVDLVSGEKLKSLREKLGQYLSVEVSATLGTGLEALESKIAAHFRLESTDETTVIIHARHEKNLKLVHEALVRARRDFLDQMSSEFICLDLREALSGIGKILGRGLGEDVINLIFKDFCIGK